MTHLWYFFIVLFYGIFYGTFMVFFMVQNSTGDLVPTIIY